VTGRLAEPAVRSVVADLGGRLGFDSHVAVLGVNVAALLTTGLVARRLTVEKPFDRAVLPGWCGGELAELETRFGFPFVRGPKDIADLETWMTGAAREPPDLSQYDVEILAEINHAPRLAESEILRLADSLRADGADVIDLGCEPGFVWPRVAAVVAALKRCDHRVSIDSFERREVEPAVDAGAELVLSCNTTNRDWASRLPAELVAIPDDPRDLESLAPTIRHLQDAGARFRIDPILEPIGFGFAASLARYFEARRRWPELPVLMGIGNLTELTAVDSAGVNAVLAGICQEIGVHSVLTTQVINWCGTAVREFDIARRIMRHSISNGLPPKHFDDRLVILRDPRVTERGQDQLVRLQAAIRDPNFRLFAEGGEVHLLNRDGYWHGSDPYEVFDRALEATGPIDSQHAFYLGYELAKAATALTLGKRYVQDEALRWGFLTRPETSAVERRHRKGPTGEPTASESD
jgi:dihydropteroate synthase-like protein